MRLVFRLGSLVMLVLSFIGGVERAHAGVYDDCAAWWHFDYAPNYTLATTNVARVNEIRDQRDWGTAATKGSTGKHASAVYGPIGGPEWTNCPVVCPAGGQKYGDYSLLFHPATNGLGQVLPDAVTVSNLRLTNSATIVTRFLWNGFTYSSSYPGWIYNNALDWTAKSGWMFGMVGGPRLGLLIGQTTLSLDTYTVATSKWYDAAAVITDNGNDDTVELFIWPQDGTLQYKKYLTNVVLTALDKMQVIGGEPYTSTYGYATNSNNGKSFCGLLNHLAVWNRALSYAEVMQAFGSPQPLFQIGLNNNSLTDLRPESEADLNYIPGNPWNTMRRAVNNTTTNCDATLRISLTNYQAKLNYAVHLKTLTDSGTSADLSLIVNNTTNATQKASNGKDLYWYVPFGQLTSGTNSLTFHYENGTCSYVGFDWLEVGGAWQIGYDNGSTAEFIAESSAGDHFYVTDPNWQHVERAIAFGDTNTVLHFFLSDELAQKYYYTYTTRIIGQGPSSLTNYAFSVEINGEYTQSFPAQANNTYISVPFDRSHNKPGENTINVMYNGPKTAAEGGGYLQFDFHRLSLSEAPKGTLIRLR